MHPGRWKDLVAAAALAAALGLGGWLLLRSHGAFGTSWTDGESRFPAETGAGIRHAVWAPAERLPGIAGDAQDPTLSPDGRLLVFGSGARGLNSELYVTELVDGVAGQAVPLGVLDTRHDELAPAFGAGALYFASDRPGGMGGLDLWRAPYADGVFGAPEPLDSGLNSAADETDPAPLADGEGLYFSSNRARGPRTDFDLYRASPDLSGRHEVEPLAELNTPADEREPALSPDQRSLYFASDRDGPFALLRTIRGREGWGAPAPVPGLATPRAQRGPWVSADGFVLLFDAAEENGERGLQRARSRELFLVLPPGVTLAEWLLLGAFLLLALLALLAKRWVALDILVKCLLVSLLVHLLLLLYFRTVHPEGGSIELQGEEDDGTFRVRLEPGSAEPAPAPTLEARRASGAESAPERERFAPSVARAEAPEVAALSVPERAPLAAPAPESAELAAAERTAEPRLAGPQEAVERYTAAAATLALPASDPALPASSGSTPARAQGSSTEIARAEPSPVEGSLAPVAAQGIESGAPARTRIEPAPAAAPDVSVAAPAETLARSAAAAPTLALPAPDSARPAASGSPTPARASGSAAPARATGTTAEVARAEPSSAEGSLAPVAAQGIEQGAPARARTEPAPAAVPSVPLAAPAESLARSSARATELALAPSHGAATRPTLDSPVERPSFTAEGIQPAVPEASTAWVRAPAAAGAAEASPAPAPESLAPQASLATSSGTPSLRAPAQEATRAAPAPAPAFDAVTGLAGPEAQRHSLESAEPERLEPQVGATRAGAATAPNSLPLAAPPTELALEPRAMEPSAATAPSSAPQAARPDLRKPVERESPAPLATRAPDLALDSGLRAAAPRPHDAAAPAPERALLADSTATPRPSARPLELEAPAAPPVAFDRAPRLPDTPYQNRFGQQKLRALEEFGGSQETEHAVAAGLAYLAHIQERDGAWGQRSDEHDKYLDVRVGKTGLALLAFLGAGHVPAGNTEHAAVAERAVRFLLGQQDEESGHLGRSCSYGHGIATYALAECFALTQDQRLKQPLERAVAEILDNQARGDDPERAGGWGYYYADDRVWNGDTWPRTSVTAWQVMALESAQLGGLRVPEQAFEGARSFLLNAWDPRARAFRYDHDPERLSSGYPILPASTPAALFALALLDVDPAHPDLAQARRFVLTRAPDGYRNTGDADFVQHARGNLYFWYYATLAMFRVGGTEWERWNGALKETLLPAQDEDGSWRPIDAYAEYAGDEDGERTYTTAMCVLSLEIYYRYFTPLLRVR